MGYCCRVCKRKTIGKNPKQRQGGTRKLGNVTKETTVPPMTLKNMRINPSQLGK